MANSVHPRISNISATFELGTKVDIDILKEKLNGYLIRRFKAVNVRNHDPYASANIFESGKVVMAGCKSIENLQKAAALLCDTLVQHGITCSVQNLQIQNIVASGVFMTKVELVYTFQNMFSLFENFDKNKPLVSYETELFPGLICKEKSKVFTVFTTGKYIITGCKTEQEIIDFFEKYYLLIIFKEELMDCSNC